MGTARLNGFPSFVECIDQNLNRLRVKNPICPERADELKHRRPSPGPIALGIMTLCPGTPKAETLRESGRWVHEVPGMSGF